MSEAATPTNNTSGAPPPGDPNKRGPSASPPAASPPAASPPAKKKTKGPATQGGARLAREWCARCVRALGDEPGLVCSNQSGTGRRCWRCHCANKGECVPIPFAAIQPLEAALKTRSEGDINAAIRALPKGKGKVVAAAAPAQLPPVAAAVEDEVLSLRRRTADALEGIEAQLQRLVRLAASRERRELIAAAEAKAKAKEDKNEGDDDDDDDDDE